MWSRKPKADPVEVVRGLREQALSMVPKELELTPGPGHTQVWGVLMEIGFPDATATLVTIVDGSTSLYFSNGGGIIGAGERAGVREASQQFVALADTMVDSFSVTSSYPFPEVGRVRFYLRTFDGTRTADAAEQDLAQQEHPLSALFVAGHTVIAAIQESGAFQ
jgi:hypothetical protein